MGRLAGSRRLSKALPNDLVLLRRPAAVWAGDLTGSTHAWMTSGPLKPAFMSSQFQPRQWVVYGSSGSRRPDTRIVAPLLPASATTGRYEATECCGWNGCNSMSRNAAEVGQCSQKGRRVVRLRTSFRHHVASVFEVSSRRRNSRPDCRDSDVTCLAIGIVRLFGQSRKLP